MLASSLLCIVVLVGLRATCLVRQSMGPKLIDRREAARPTRAVSAPRVVVLVLDGLAPRLVAEAHTPRIDALAAEGLVATRAANRDPATSPGVASIVSGLPASVHRFGGSSYSSRRRFEHETVYTACGRAGLRCGFFTCKPKLATLVEHEPGAELYVVNSDDDATIENAARYLVHDDADFAVVHLCAPDRAGHRAGWGSPRQMRAIEETDERVGRFVGRVASEADDARPLSLLVVSDHGGKGFGHGGESPANMDIVWFAIGTGIPAGVIDTPVAIQDTAATALDLLGLEPPASWRGRSRLRPPPDRAP